MARPPGPVHISTATGMLGPGSSRPSKGLYFSLNSLMRRKSAFYFLKKRSLPNWQHNPNIMGEALLQTWGDRG